MLPPPDVPAGPSLPPGVGPRPDGDPEAMRVLARQLRGFAGMLAGQSTVDLVNWESARAREVKAQIGRAATVSDRASERLRRLATRIDREADHVEKAQVAWSVRYSRAINADSSIPRDKK